MGNKTNLANKFVVYRASAGSGKTFTLVKEYLRLAFGGNDVKKDFKNILAITFTNKATTEMKSRILKELSEMKDPSAPSDMAKKLAQDLACTPQDLAKKATTLETAILHNYSDLSVNTIDSFFSTLVRNFAIDLGLPQNFATQIDDTDMLDNVVETMLDDVGSADKQLTDVVVGFAMEKMDDGKSYNVKGDLRDIAPEILKENALDNLKKLSNVQDFAEIYHNLKKQREIFKNNIKQIATDILNCLHRNGFVSDDDFNGRTRGYHNWVEKLTNSETNYQSVTIFKQINEGNNFFKKNTPQSQSVAPQMAKAYNDIQTEFKKYLSCQEILKKLYQIAVLNKLHNKLEDYYREEGIQHISENNKKISQVVQNEDAPFIYERLGVKYKHILIDEFQDTSILQWQNILPLVVNGLAEAYTSLIVGDGKQAIYRFRQGDVEQFQNITIPPNNSSSVVKQHYNVLKNNTKVENLDTNYRSSEYIIKFNNTFFQHIVNYLDDNNLASQLMKDIYIGNNKDEPALKQNTTPQKTGGCVEIQFMPKGNKTETTEAIAEAMYQSINDLLSKGYEYRDIAILAHANKQLSDIANLLLAKANEENKELPIASCEALKLFNSKDVQALVSLLKYLYDYQNKVACLEIACYLSGNHNDNTLLDIFLTSNKDNFFDNFSTTIKNKYSFNSDTLNSQTLYDCCYELTRIFKIEKTPFVYTFLNKVLEYSNKNRTNFGEFIEWLGDDRLSKISIQTSENLNAIKLLTVHKSKGLEFPVVLYCPQECFIDGRRENDIWIDVDPSISKDLHVGYIACKKDPDDLIFANQCHEENHKSRLDALNALYVACTRPEKRLYMYVNATPEKGATDNISKVIADFVKNSNNGGLFKNDNTWQLGNPEEICNIKRKNDKTQKSTLKNNDSKNWNNFLNIVETKKTSLSEEQNTQAQRLGNIVHDILSKIITPNNTDAILEDYFQKQTIDEYLKNEVVSRVKSVLKNEATKKFFTPEFQVKTECEILFENEILRPDRIVFTPTETWIVDFKTGDKNPKYNNQVKTYQKSLEAMNYPCVKAFLLYITDNDCQVEEVK